MKHPLHTYSTCLLTILVFALLGVGKPTVAQEDPNQLVGTWKVDLRTTPDADDYYREMVITSVDGGSIEGTFYGSPIQIGHLNLDWGAVRFAFVTSDGSNDYYTSGTLSGDQIEALTHTVGRGFLAYWTAVKLASED